MSGGRDRLRYAVGSRGARLAIDAVLGTAHFERVGQEHYRQFIDAGGAVIFVLWHGRLLPLSYLHRHEGVVTLISRSADGEYIARIVEQWGYAAVRGSSSRGGGSALREMVRHGRSGRSLAITPDGPRGPRQRMKPGALMVAQLTGLPVIPAVAGTDRAWWFEGWDRFMVPKPFAHIRVAYGAPHWVPRDLGAEGVERIGVEIAGALDALLAEVDGAATR